MEGVLAAFDRRPVAGVGLVVVLAWCCVVAVEVTTQSLLDRGGWYGVLVTAIDFAWRGVAGVAAAVWLVERAAG